MKLKEIGPRGGEHVPDAPLDPPLDTTTFKLIVIFTIEICLSFSEMIRMIK